MLCNVFKDVATAELSVAGSLIMIMISSVFLVKLYIFVFFWFITLSVS